MHAAEVIRILYKERKDWASAKESGAGPEVSWTLNGIDKCMKLVRDLAHEQRKRAQIYKPRLRRWAAADLYHAIKVALDAFNRGDRARGLRTLQEALEKVDKERTLA